MNSNNTEWKGTKYESLVYRDKKLEKDGLSLELIFPDVKRTLKSYNWMKDKKHRLKRYKDKPDRLPYYRKFYRNVNVIYNGIKRRISEHVFVWMMHFEREYETKQYLIHHVDDDRQNNNIDNLCLLTRSQHIRYHNKHMIPCADTLYRFLKHDEEMMDHEIANIWDRWYQ